MTYRAQIVAATRRLRAASSEIHDQEAAAQAYARMAYLWAWSVRQEGVLDGEDLEVAIWSYFMEYPDGMVPAQEPE